MRTISERIFRIFDVVERTFFAVHIQTLLCRTRCRPYAIVIAHFLDNLVEPVLNQEFKPLFIGLIAGETIFLGLHVLYNLVCLLLNGTAPAQSISVMPV